MNDSIHTQNLFPTNIKNNNINNNMNNNTDNIMKITYINDIRSNKELSSITFSNYKKTEVVKSFMKSLIYSKIEASCYWCAELICSGHVTDVWSILINFYCKYIHIGNVKIAIYLEHKYKQFDYIQSIEYKMTPLQIRNDEKIRKMFAEIICILSDATRKHCIDNIKIGTDDFDMEYMKTRFKAPSTCYAEQFFYQYDPKEFIIAINELGYHINEGNQNTIMACYWIEWIYGFENLQKLKKETYECEPRRFAPVDIKFHKEIVWMIWEILLDCAEKKGQLIKKIVNAFLFLFCIHYTKTSYKKRKYILYIVVNILCESISLTEEIIKENQQIKTTIVIENINMIYKQMKSFEQSGGTEYLLDGITT